ncbi:MAG: DUF2948 family protein [Paracoccaceae bacterium]|nr:DUF2948 family protein [Paracoccaceae bacterium]MDE2912127.1 DUF2948 family protein [Paracoccaceae bacterium]
MASTESGQSRRGRPLNLMAVDAEDLQVVSTLLQDAILVLPDLTWQADRRRFAMLVNRFRWEAAGFRAQRKGITERVRSLLVADSVQKVASRGLGLPESTNQDPLSVLSVAFDPGDLPAGALRIRFSGNATIRLDVECLDLTLRDVTRPYRAPSGAIPVHDLS